MTIGKYLPEKFQYIDIYFNQMKKESKNQQLADRIRFRLQDVIELRENKWKDSKDCFMTRKLESPNFRIKGAKREIHKKSNQYKRGDGGNREGSSSADRLRPSRGKLSISPISSKVITQTLSEVEAKEAAKSIRETFRFIGQ
jgi:hypothetical protein